MGASARWRKTYVASLIELCAALTLYFNVPYPMAMAMRRSDATALVQSDTYKKYLENKKSEAQIYSVVIECINNVVKSIGNLGKLLARR
jgi:hypothetical protein